MGRRCGRFSFSNCHSLASDALSDCFSGTLELKASKENAHTSYVMSVAFAPDGKTIVSGSDDRTIKVWDAESLTILEERKGDTATLDKSGEVADRDGATLRLKEDGAFYAPSTLECVALHWPRLVAGAQSGELYHLEVEGTASEMHELGYTAAELREAGVGRRGWCRIWCRLW